MKKIILILSACVFANIARSQSGYINTYAGTGTPIYSGDGGQATAANLYYPDQLSWDAAGDLIIGDNNNNVVQKITPAGIISTIAGNGVQGFSGDGGQATAAEFYYPAQVGYDAIGNIYIADQKNNRVRKVDATTGIITTIAGTGVAGYNGDGGQATAAEINGPIGMLVDAIGNCYFAETPGSVVRKVSSSGIISTFAGNGISGSSGDGGPATAAELNGPIGISFDATGNIYIADAFNSKIREVNMGTGTILTIAGTGGQGYGGDGGPATAATFHFPSGVDVDSHGNMFIADYGNNMVRMVSASSGNVSTIAGNGIAGYSGDGGPATAAEFNALSAVLASPAGDVYIADQKNNRVRKLNAITGIATISDNNSLHIYPNPAENTLFIDCSMLNGKSQIAIIDITGREVISRSEEIKSCEILPVDVSTLSKGMYFVKVSTQNSSGVSKFIKQ